MQWRKYLRFLASIQLLPALESGEETLVGGQAVLEGVMMRSPHAWGIAVRRPSGEIASHSEPLERPSDKHRWMRLPVVRGVITLGYAMMLGFRALRFSANVALNEAQAGVAPEKKIEIKGWVAALNIAISLGFFIFMYKFLPLLAATELKRVSPSFDSQFWFNVIDGAIRIALFLAFIWATSLWKDLRRVYQYHGAEHKTVFAFESGDPLTIPNAQKYSTFHPRCGTSFLMTVMLVSIAIYMTVPVTSFAGRFAIRLALLPLIIGISYEIIRFAARLRNQSLAAGRPTGAAAWLFHVLTAPGLWLQRITTQPPADDQVECAILALNDAMELEKARGGQLVIA
ncbi:MAG: DUF1385 domain-containing protein [Terriglobales bacterium]